MKKSKFTEQQIAFALRQPSAPSRLDGGVSRDGLLPVREPGLDRELAGRKADSQSKRVLGPRIPDYDNSPEDFGP